MTILATSSVYVCYTSITSVTDVYAGLGGPVKGTFVRPGFNRRQALGFGLRAASRYARDQGFVFFAVFRVFVATFFVAVAAWLRDNAITRKDDWTMKNIRSYAVAALAGMIVLVGVSATGQVQRSPATLDDVLAEIKGLRADLVQASSVGVRVQALTARLTLQEQRIANMSRQFISQQTSLDEAAEKRRSADERLKSFETAVSSSALSQAQEADLRSMIPRQRDEAARLAADEQRLRSELITLSNQIATEQGLWTTFSSRLDELERSLPASR
jgi:chromosome segregation ATPase